MITHPLWRLLSEARKRHREHLITRAQTPTPLAGYLDATCPQGAFVSHHEPITIPFRLGPRDLLPKPLLCPECSKPMTVLRIRGDWGTVTLADVPTPRYGLGTISRDPFDQYQALGDAARLLKVPLKDLRAWKHEQLIKPTRGLGRWFLCPKVLHKSQRIRELLQAGYSLPTIKQMLRGM